MKILSEKFNGLPLRDVLYFKLYLFVDGLSMWLFAGCILFALALAASAGDMDSSTSRIMTLVWIAGIVITYLVVKLRNAMFNKWRVIVNQIYFNGYDPL